MSDDQLTKLDNKIDNLSETLDNKIDKLDQKIGTIAELLGEQNLKLYKHMEQRFDQLEAKIDTKADKTAVDHIYQTLDSILARLESDEQERLAINHQLDRHEGWFKQLSKSTNTVLVPEP